MTRIAHILKGMYVLFVFFVFCTATLQAQDSLHASFTNDTLPLLQLKVAAARSAGLDTTTAFRQQQAATREALLNALLARWQTKRPGRSFTRVHVQQIVRLLPQQISSVQLERAKAQMDSLYQLIQQDSTCFAHLVATFSDDKHGHWIAPQQTTAELENVAFGLQPGEVSPPFFTPEGIYILKVTQRDEAVSIPSQLAETTDSLLEQVKEKLNYSPCEEGMKELCRKGRTDQVLFTIEGHPYDGLLFRNFSASHPQAVERQLKAFITKSLLDAEYDYLKYRSPELLTALQDSDDRYLLRAITRIKVDEVAANDSTGLASYFRQYADNYRWGSFKYKGPLLQAANRKTAKRAKKLLKKLPEREWAEAFRQTLTPEDAQLLIEQVQKDYRTFVKAHWESQLEAAAKAGKRLAGFKNS
jgi:peptidyl-prolyl cis-trans isomerase SurA